MTKIKEYFNLPEKAVRLDEIIRDFDDTLEMRWIPPENRNNFGGGEKPFSIWQIHPNYEPYMVMSLDESELDHRVLARLFQARNLTIDDLEAEEAALRVMKLKEQLELQEADAEFTRWAVGTDRTVRHNGVTYK